MKKAFTLMEVIIAVSLLSVVMLSLFQVKGNNIFILEKSKENKKQNEYLSLVMDSTEYSKRNENVYLDKYFNILDDDIRREFKEIKIKIKDEILEEKDVIYDDILFKIGQYKTTFSLEKGISKNIYRFNLEI